MARTKKLNTLKTLDMMLLGIVDKMETLECEQKDSPYLKLTELFFKGIDLREKLAIKDNSQDVKTKSTIIVGLDTDKI